MWAAMLEWTLWKRLREAYQPDELVECLKVAISLNANEQSGIFGYDFIESGQSF